MTSLVTGAAGFLGRNLTSALVRSGERVVAFGRANQRPSPSAGVTGVNADFNTFGHWAALLEGHSLNEIVHIVARYVDRPLKIN
jgi:nucleoside-diphosphate-sugar epimerase